MRHLAVLPSRAIARAVVILGSVAVAPFAAAQGPAGMTFSIKPNATVGIGGAPVTRSYTGAVMLSAPAPAGGVIATLITSDPSLIGIPQTVTIAAGERNAPVDVRVMRSVSRTVPFTITVTAIGVTRQARDSVLPPAVSRIEVASPGGGARFNPTRTVRSGGTGDLRLTLSHPAPREGLDVVTHADVPQVGMPASVHFDDGDTVRTVIIRFPSGNKPQQVEFTAATPGGASTLPVTIRAIGITSHSFTPGVAIGGQTVSGTISLDQAATGGPFVMQLTSSDPGVAEVPATVSVPAGAFQVNFPVVTRSPMRTVTVTITIVTSDNRYSMPLEISPAAVTSMTLPASVRGGLPQTLVLTAPERHGGFTVTLVADSVALVQVPATVTFAPNESRKQVTVQTAPVVAPTRVTLRVSPAPRVVAASLTTPFSKGIANGASATVLLTPPVLTGVTLSGTGLVGGSTDMLQGVVTLDGAPPVGFGRYVGLQSDVPALTMTQVQFAPGSTRGVFEVRARQVAAVQSGTITVMLQSDARRVTVPVRVAPQR